MASDKKYLKWNGSSWIFQKKIDQRVAKLLGQKSNVYNESLRTDSLREAQGLRHQKIAWLNKLKEAEDINPSYADVMSQYSSMSENELNFKRDLLSEHIESEYGHLGHPEWENLSDEEKKLSNLPTKVDAKNDLEFKVLSQLVNKDPNFLPPQTSRLTLKDALDKHLKEIESDIAYKTVGKYKNSVNQFQIFIGQKDVYVYSIQRIHVRDFITSLKEVEKAKSTIVNYISNLGSIWDYARDAENLNTPNPFHGHRIASKKKGNKKFYKNWKPKDLNKVIDALEDDLDKLPVYIAWHTGSRINECYSVKPKDIKVDKETKIKYIAIKEEWDGKTEAITRNVPIHKQLEEKLKDFTGFKRPTSDAYGRVFARKKKSLGFTKKKNSFHSIRGNASTNLERLQCPSHIASQIVGHKDKGDSFTYNYYSEGAGLKVLKEWVDKLPIL
jgi:integrase|tara:strand:- start:37 stop:1362 length:1326 start_codon:yes stop_codon:yes gene_type:complete